MFALGRIEVITVECRHCGMLIDDGKDCPKCDLPAEKQKLDELYVIDVAHNGETWDQAEAKIMEALDACLYQHYKGLKVIHGRGAHRGSGIIRARATQLMRYLAEQHNGKYTLDKHTEGASLIYFN